MKIKFHNYLTEKYVHTEYITLSNHEKVYSDEGIEIMNAAKRLSFEQLKKIGVEEKDDIWQEIKLTDEIKNFILEKGAINKTNSEKEMEKNNKVKEERKAKKERDEATKKAELLKKATETGEKQLLSTSSVMGDDGNLIIIYKYIDRNGVVSTSEFHDTD